MKRFEFKIHGPLKGGKNNMLMTRTGRHYPNPKWAAWRDRVVRELREIIPPGLYFDGLVSMKVTYTPYDLKRRDLPAMVDSIFHCIEKAGLVKDDSFVINLYWTTWAKDKEKAGATVVIEEL